MVFAAQMTQRDPVHVACGLSDHSGPLAGLTVGEAKLSLSTVLNIPYFSGPLVNGHAVPLDHNLRPGDRLEFHRLFGAKGASTRPREGIDAERLLKIYEDELRALVAHVVAETTEALFSRLTAWAEERFGPPTAKAIAVLELVEKRLRPTGPSRAAPADRGKPGRKPCTADIAQFANKRRPGKTWKEICVEWKRQHPNDPRTAKLTLEKVREAWRRYYGSKKSRAN